MAQRSSYESVTEYLAAQPPPARAVLKRVRGIIRKALPRAEEAISYQIPMFKLNGKMVLYVAGFQHHYSIYPATAKLIRAAPELKPFLHSKATLRFSYDEPIPTRLITRVAKLRAAEAALTVAKRR
jgi:uncharacterized protein YdhG (YjbR/CyaY superfamily)